MEIKKTRSVLEHIAKARDEGLKRGFKLNTIVIDEDLAYSNGFGVVLNSELRFSINPTIMGLNISYKKNLKKEYGYNFIIGNNEIETTEKTLDDFTNDELIEELRRRLEIKEPKQNVPKKVYLVGDGYANGFMVYDIAYCPCCNEMFEDGRDDWEAKYCKNCGQALDWSDLNEPEVEEDET